MHAAEVIYFIYGKGAKILFKLYDLEHRNGYTLVKKMAHIYPCR